MSYYPTDAEVAPPRTPAFILSGAGDPVRSAKRGYHRAQTNDDDQMPHHGVSLPRDRWLESTSLQRCVCCELEARLMAPKSGRVRRQGGLFVLTDGDSCQGLLSGGKRSIYAHFRVYSL
jgi:hypothetical protein